MQLFAMHFVAAVNKQGLTSILHEEVNLFFNLPCCSTAFSFMLSVLHTLLLQWSKSKEGNTPYLLEGKLISSFNDIRGVQDIICSISQRILIAVSSVEIPQDFFKRSKFIECACLLA
ncbi:hypothetical protein IMY05_015G0120900 [Salix suchowensis]|nr:hypothetical protein IMY05_015G0120900 [Salix suchowensis]